MLEITRIIAPAEIPKILELFATAFNDKQSYISKVPNPQYLQGLLGNPNFIALGAFENDEIVGALCAYFLPKFEQERGEIYIYDLAVLETHRRRKIATQLIEKLRQIGCEIGAWVIFVQGDHGDEPALALYDKIGTREEVLHFDIDINKPLC